MSRIVRDEALIVVKRQTIAKHGRGNYRTNSKFIYYGLKIAKKYLYLYSHSAHYP